MVTEFLLFDVFPLSFKSFVFYLQCGWLIGFIGMILVEVFFLLQLSLWCELCLLCRLF